MARIRAIKPEFWSSPNLPGDPWARLLYMAMWNWADDMGVGTANPRELAGFAFPNDEEITPGGVRRMFVEIRRAFDVEFYTVAGRPYFAIPNWEKHQKFDNRSKGKHPGPEFAETRLYLGKEEDSAEPAGNPSNPRSVAVAGTGEQGNRGTGEQSSLSPDESDDRGTLIPADWRPNQGHIDKAVSLHLDVANEYQRFRSNAEQKQRRLKNWNTGFTNWLRKSAEYNQQRAGRAWTPKRPTNVDGNLALVEQYEKGELS